MATHPNPLLPLPHLPSTFLLLFLLLTSPAASAADSGATKGIALIKEMCEDTNYQLLCVSSLASRPGSSRVLFKDLGSFAVDAVLQSATRTSKQIAQTLSRLGRREPPGRWALETCKTQYDMAVYNLEMALNYMKSRKFADTFEYGPVERYVGGAQKGFGRCGETMRRQRAIGKLLRRRNEITRRLADNAYVIVGDLMV